MGTLLAQVTRRMTLRSSRPSRALLNKLGRLSGPAGQRPGEYRIFDFDKELDPSKFAEGDKVTVTYTGELGSEDPAPVAILIQKDA